MANRVAGVRMVGVSRSSRRRTFGLASLVDAKVVGRLDRVWPVAVRRDCQRLVKPAVGRFRVA
jgi:hypothetical protein